MKKEFWKDWKNLTAQEKRGIKSLKLALKIIKERYPKGSVIAVYCGGSFIRREMKRGSDIDLFVIVKDMKAQRITQKLIKEYYKKHDPYIGFSGYTLWELKTGRHSKQINRLRTGPKRFVSKMDNYAVVYGKKLDSSKFPVNTPEKYLQVMLKVFDKQFLPLYKEGKLRFGSILKQVFWLVDHELSVKGNHPPHSWKAITQRVPKGHIAKKAWKLRYKEKVSEKEKKEFIKDLRAYLRELKKLVADH